MAGLLQRLFGHTIMDALRLCKNAWYIDGQQVTRTAAQLNAISTTPPALSVSASSLAADVVGKGLLGANSTPIRYDNTTVHYNVVPGTLPYVNPTVPGMQTGDTILGVLVVQFGWNIWNHTSYYTASNGVMIKTSPYDDSAGVYWVTWVDNT